MSNVCRCSSVYYENEYATLGIWPRTITEIVIATQPEEFVISYHAKHVLQIDLKLAI